MPTAAPSPPRPPPGRDRSPTPLEIHSPDHLPGHPVPGETGRERFSVEARRVVPVRFPDERLAGGPQRLDMAARLSGFPPGLARP